LISKAQPTVESSSRGIARICVRSFGTPFARLLFLLGTLYAAFGGQSPYLPSLLQSRNLLPQAIALVLAAGTEVRRVSPVVTMRSRSLGGGSPNAGDEPHPSCNDCSLTVRAGQKERPKHPEKSLPDNNS
jgi:hypothetical protein